MATNTCIAMDSRGLDDGARWHALRRAQSDKPATYRCPFCNEQLHAMSEHVLIAPEGDASQRRHAHLECVAAARATGAFRTYDDWRERQPVRPGAFARALRSVARRFGALRLPGSGRRSS